MMKINFKMSLKAKNAEKRILFKFYTTKEINTQ